MPVRIAYLNIVALILGWSNMAWALNPEEGLSEYKHLIWRSGDQGLIGHGRSVAQSGDGYLWVGTTAGLFRFDGVRFTEWREADGASIGPTRLHRAMDGSLWISAIGRGIFRDQDRKVETIDPSAGGSPFSSVVVTDPLEARPEHPMVSCGAGPEYSVVLEGRPRDLSVVVRDEAYRVVREAVCNAYQHAEARHIEIEVTFGSADLTIRVRDDGIGVPPEILARGQRPGHWGLAGMRERCESFGGHLHVWSEGNAGTEVEPCIPAHVAYARASTSLFSRVRAHMAAVVQNKLRRKIQRHV